MISIRIEMVIPSKIATILPPRQWLPMPLRRPGQLGLAIHRAVPETRMELPGASGIVA